MKLDRLIALLERIAPLYRAEAWDKVGLHVGGVSQNIRRAMLCIDLTEPVIAEAAKARTNLVVSYHPPIFEPLAALTDATWKQRVTTEAVRRRIAVYSPHTALDAAEGGVNDWLAHGVGDGEVAAVMTRPNEQDLKYKIITFVPLEWLDKVRRAKADAGAGCIGAYSECSFSVEGEGTFRGDASTSPAVGKAGRFERVAEHRLEMVVTAGLLDHAVRMLREAHPYEEPAIDVYRLEPVDAPGRSGLGRVITLKKAVSRATLVQRVKKHLGVKHVEVADAGRPIRRVAVCAGAGGSVLEAMTEQPDAFITGEMRHHDVLDAVSQGVTVLLAGHTHTERPYLREYRRRIIREGGGKGVDWLISRTDKAPTTIR